MLITLVFWALNFGTVIFGILHLIGVSIILAYPFLRYRFLNVVLGLTVIAVGVYMQARDVSSESAWMAPLGVVPDNLFMPDYRPLLPWFGVVLLGIFFGNAVYLAWRRRKPASEMPSYVAPLAFLGRNTLFIYLVHQPVFIAVLFALGMIRT